MLFKIVYLNILNIVLSVSNYDMYIFSRSWIPSFCKFNTQNICNGNHSNYNKFTIHGLWPNWNNGSWPQYCSNSSLDYNMFDTIVPDMSLQWSDNFKPSWKLWNHEWKKHGTCAVGNLYIKNSNDYFISALWLNMRMNINYIIKKYNIIPSNIRPYYKKELEDIFDSSLICKKYNGKYILTEIRNQISLNFSIIVPSIDDNSCGNNIYLITLS